MKKTKPTIFSCFGRSISHNGKEGILNIKAAVRNIGQDATA